MKGEVNPLGQFQVKTLIGGADPNSGARGAEAEPQDPILQQPAHGAVPRKGLTALLDRERFLLGLYELHLSGAPVELHPLYLTGS